MRALELVVSFGDTVLDVQRIAHEDDARAIVASVSDHHPPPAVSLRAGSRWSNGALSFEVRRAIDRVSIARRSVRDWAYARVFTISALAHLFLAVAAFLTPDGSELFAGEIHARTVVFRDAIFAKEKKVAPVAAGKAPEKEGRVGVQKARLADAAASKQRNSGRRDVKSAGLLGVLHDSGGQLGFIFQRGGLGGGLNETIGGLRGTGAMADAHGFGGMGTRGTGPGGGGDALGIGGLTVRGRGGALHGISTGLGVEKHRTEVLEKHVTCSDCVALSKEEISAVIRRNLPRFKYCYEKQLNANPNLEGKVAISFTIGPTGDVVSAMVRDTTIGDERVDSCVMRVMTSLKFPRPRGGGVVIVSYPFIFQTND